MRNNIAIITAVFVLAFSGLAMAKMEEGKGMMGGGMMMKHMEMMKGMQTNMVATSDGGVIVLSGGKLIKYDNQLNVVKQIELPKCEMCKMMGKGKKKMDMDNDDDDKDASSKPAENHAAHH